MIAKVARRLWRLLAAMALSLAAGIAVIAGWDEFSLLLRAALLALMMLLLAIPYFKKILQCDGFAQHSPPMR